jgi:hypothetical protein
VAFVKCLFFLFLMPQSVCLIFITVCRGSHGSLRKWAQGGNCLPKAREQIVLSCFTRDRHH